MCRMQTDLNMNAHNNAYTIVSLVFFFTYAIGQPPATVLIRKIGPRIFLSFIVFAWGVVMIVSTYSAWSLLSSLTSLGRASVSSTHGRSWPSCVSSSVSSKLDSTLDVSTCSALGIHGTNSRSATPASILSEAWRLALGAFLPTGSSRWMACLAWTAGGGSSSYVPPVTLPHHSSSCFPTPA